MLRSLLVVISAISGVFGGGLGDIKHVVILMQEGRSFDHYFGTMAGVRGFHDPNVKVVDGKTVYFQKSGRNDTSRLLPFHLAANETYREPSQCFVTPDDSGSNFDAWNNGKMDSWVINYGPYSWSYFKREDIPVHFEIAEGWTVADMYSESDLTIPSLDRTGEPYGKKARMEGDNMLKEKFLKNVGVSWYFQKKQSELPRDQLKNVDSPKWQNFSRGINEEEAEEGQFHDIKTFFERAKDGNLTALTYIMTPPDLSELAPVRPNDGAWFQKRVIEAITNSPKYNQTVLFISYGDTGGFGDHVEPYISENGTEDEWVHTFPSGNVSSLVPTGPGFRVPFYAISPYTRGGRVFTEPSDHYSQLLFLEKWAKESYNLNFTVTSIPQWRREHMSDLVNMFNFDRPDLSIPILSQVEEPNFHRNGTTDNVKKCQEKYKDLAEPPVPYGNQTEATSLQYEKGYKLLRGNLTEGRYLVIERYQENRSARTNNIPFASTLKDGLIDFTTSPGCAQYSCIEERFTVHSIEPDSNKFYLKSYLTKSYMDNNAMPTNTTEQAAPLTILFDPAEGYTIQNDDGKYLLFSFSSLEEPQFSDIRTTYNFYSVSY